MRYLIIAAILACAACTGNVVYLPDPSPVSPPAKDESATAATSAGNCAPLDGYRTIRFTRLWGDCEASIESAVEVRAGRIEYGAEWVDTASCQSTLHETDDGRTTDIELHWRDGWADGTATIVDTRHDCVSQYRVTVD